jgi:hypothetical protein
MKRSAMFCVLVPGAASVGRGCGSNLFGPRPALALLGGSLGLPFTFNAKPYPGRSDPQMSQMNADFKEDRGWRGWARIKNIFIRAIREIRGSFYSGNHSRNPWFLPLSGNRQEIMAPLSGGNDSNRNAILLPIYSGRSPSLQFPP